jgi:hypothetical protein
MIKSQKQMISKIYAAPVVVMTTLLTNMLPSHAVIDSYRNDYRTCAAQLKKAGVTPQAASQGCANALRPRELSVCVAKITKQTQIPAADALYSCSQARRPEDVATCVVGISKNTKQENNQATLGYCGRSLLPVTFAECVVGLRKEIDLEPLQALDTCINTNERSVGIGAGSATTPELTPSVENVPMSSTPSGNY